MYYMEDIKYHGDPLKAVVGDGLYLWTLVSPEVPVTTLVIQEMLATFAYSSRMEPWVKASGIRILFPGFHDTKGTLIGEKLIIFQILGALLKNSIEAKASTLEVSAEEEAETVRFVVADDGEGVPEPILKAGLFQPFVTTRSNGVGLDLFDARNQMKKLGGSMAYRGKGLEGRGATFVLTFLKKMPG